MIWINCPDSLLNHPQVQEVDAGAHLPVPVSGHVRHVRQVPPQPDPGRDLFRSDCSVGQPRRPGDSLIKLFFFGTKSA
jgi:hypothetical protein